MFYLTPTTMTALRKSMFALLAGSVLTFNACQKDDPSPEVEQEEFNRAVFTFTRLDASGNETAEKVVAELDELEHNHGSSGGAHDHEHVHVDLKEGATYRMAIGLYIDDKSINDEIMDEGDVHQFFFIPSVSGIVNYQYEDRDRNNRPVGLKGKLQVLQHGELDLNVILRHNLDKAHAGAATWNSANYAAAGGADDLNAELEIHADH
jgi:hypothetical protein